jgi:ABC-type transporter Mla MlaB component
MVALSGGVTVRRVRDAWATLQAALSEPGDLTLDLCGVTDADLSLVQLVEAARVSAEGAGRRLTLASPADGPLHDVLRRGGFLHAPERREFWLGETLQ